MDLQIDNNPYAADDLKPKWKYLVDQEQRDDEHICHFTELIDLRIGDFSCGSGHIVGYVFEILFDLYIYEGYYRRSAVEHILKDNLTGVDIDLRLVHGKNCSDKERIFLANVDAGIPAPAAIHVCVTTMSSRATS